MGKALPVGLKIIEQGRSSVQQALLPFYFGADYASRFSIGKSVFAQIESVPTMAL